MVDTTPKTLLLDKFDAGLVTRVPIEKAPPSSFVNCQNVALNDKLIPTKDNGHSKYNATTLGAYPVRGACVYKRADGTKYYVVACGGKLYYSTAGSGSFSAYQIGGADMTFSADADVSLTQYNNKLYMVNGEYPVITNASYTTARMIKIDGTTVTALTVSDIPQGLEIILIANERMFGIKSNDQPNGVYWTNADFNYTTDAETNWTPAYGVNYDYVGKDDGENLAGMAQYQGYIYLFKPHNVYRYSIIGDITQWASTRCDTRLGAMYHRTIQEFYGSLMYLSPEGVVKFDGNSAVLVDDAIRDKILALAQLRTNSRQWNQTLTTDFDDGTYGALLLDISGDQIMQIPQTSQADWDAGTKDNVDTSTSAGDVRLLNVALNKTVTAGGGSASNLPNMVDASDDTSGNINSGLSTDYMYVKIDLGATYTLEKIFCKQYDWTYGLGMLQYSTDGEAWTTLGYLWTGSSFRTWFTVNAAARYIRFYVDGGGEYRSLFVNTCSAFVSTSGSIETQTLDYGFTPNAYGNLSAEVTASGNATMTFQTSSSADGIAWDSWVNIGSAGENNGAINSTPQRYLKCKAILTLSAATVSNFLGPILHQLYTGASYRSTIKDLGAAPASWGKFDAGYTLNSQTLTFWMRSATTSGGVASATWYQQTPGNTITSVGLNQYIQIEVRFNTTLYSQIPVLDSFQIAWYTGTSLLSPCAAVWKKEYWLNIVDTGQSVNNLVYKYNIVNYWLTRTNKYNNVFFIDEDKLLGGTSESDGYVREHDIGAKDDTTNIDSWFELPKLEIARYEKIFREVKLTHKSDAAWTFSYKIDDGAYTDITISAAAYATTVRKMFSGIKAGRFIQFKLRQNAEDANWQIHAIELMYQIWRELNYA